MSTADDRTQIRDVRFWKSEKPHSVVFDNVTRLRRGTNPRRQQYLVSAALYDEAEFSTIGALYGWSDGMDDLSPALSLNCVRPNVDTLTAQLCKARPLPMALTVNGTQAQQTRAKKLNDVIEGQFSLSRVWETNQCVIRDACLYGTGFVYCYRDGDRVLYDRLFPWEVEVDPRDAVYGRPRTMYVTRIIDKLVLQEMYPDHALEIERSNVWLGDFFAPSKFSDNDSVIVCEAWHLPSTPGAGDGSHVICVSEATLIKEEYKHDSFPVFPLYITPPSIGYYGTGMGKMLTGVQYTVNVLAQRCQRHAELAPSYLYVPNGTDIQVDSLDNCEWPILSGNPGMQPTAVQPAPFPPQLWEFTKQVFDMSFNVTSVSASQARSEMPRGLKDASGIAIQLQNENRSERFYVASKLYEQFCVDIAWHMIRLFDEIVKDQKRFKVRTTVKRGNRKVLEEVDYKKVRMDHDEFTLDVWPTSMLPNEPVMKAATVESWVNAGWINKAQAVRLLNFPDINRVQNLDSAQYDVIDGALDRIFDEDVPVDEAYTPPDEMYDLNYALQAGLKRINMAMNDGEDEERIDLLRDWIWEVTDMMPAPDPTAAPIDPATPAQPEMAEGAAPAATDTGLTPSELAGQVNNGGFQGL